MNGTKPRGIQRNWKAETWERKRQLAQKMEEDVKRHIELHEVKERIPDDERLDNNNTETPTR